jgi:endonuclease VIII
VPDRIATPHPRFARDRWPERLQGRAVTSVDAHGKHLFLRFEGGLTIHSHLRMSGKWRVRDSTYTPPRNTWLVITRDDHLVAQINGPVLELMTDSRTRFDRRLAMLGPDILAPELDEDVFLRRLREDDPTRPIGDALIDQRIIAGIGNLWKIEGCWLARVDPWRRTGDVSDAEALAILHATRPRMQESARDGMQDRFKVIYGTAGRPCPRCGELIRASGQGEDNRTTYWCPRCQR